MGEGLTYLLDTQERPRRIDTNTHSQQPQQLLHVLPHIRGQGKLQHTSQGGVDSKKKLRELVLTDQLQAHLGWGG